MRTITHAKRWHFHAEAIAKRSKKQLLTATLRFRKVSTGQHSALSPRTAAKMKTAKAAESRRWRRTPIAELCVAAAQGQRQRQRRRERGCQGVGGWGGGRDGVLFQSEERTCRGTELWGIGGWVRLLNNTLCCCAFLLLPLYCPAPCLCLFACFVACMGFNMG